MLHSCRASIGDFEARRSWSTLVESWTSDLCSSSIRSTDCASSASPVLAGDRQVPGRLLLTRARVSRSADHPFARKRRKFDDQTFGYRPRGKVTVLIQDFEDFGYGAAGTLPANFIQFGIEPFNLVFETLPSAERIGLMSSHEFMHIVVGDKPGGRDAAFRSIFGGKILPNVEDPVSMPSVTWRARGNILLAGFTKAPQPSWKPG